jgi:murein DD-endopeptidase MepM/ murein hydrolase activator NlpD
MPQRTQKRVQLGPHVLRLVFPAGLSLLALALLVTTERLEAYSRSPFPLLPAPRFSPAIAPSVTLPTPASALLDRARVPVKFTLLRGETVSQVFRKLGLAAGEAQHATAALSTHVDVRSLRAGNRYSAFFNPDSSLASFELTLRGSGRLGVNRQGESWQAYWQPFERTSEPKVVRGVLDGSLEGSIRAAGGPAQLAYRMADVLQWDIDFSRDLQRGDRFEVVYDEIRVEREVDGVGAVHAVAYQSRGRRLEAYRFGEEGGYYDADGRPLKKMFLRSPMRYSQITSRFSHRRFHPVLKQYRPHYGVDYGAPTGTPVRVTANGVVTSAGWDRGGGRVVKVRHAQGYMTAYLHLSRFARGTGAGARVKQGDIIGYVGATGLATAPHLDYRVQHNGRWIDPLSLKSVRDEPIPAAQLAAFQSYRDAVRDAFSTGAVPKWTPSVGLDGTALAVTEVAPQPPVSVRAR